MALPVDSS